MENLSKGDSDSDSDCDGGKTKSTPSLGFRLRLEFDKKKNSTLFEEKKGGSLCALSK